MTDPKNVSLQVSHTFAAASERVFDAWLDPKKAGKFLFATPTGEMVKVEIDARIGGKFRFVERRDGIDVEHVGEYLEIERPKRLVFSFGVPLYSDQFTRVAIDIVSRGTGCELTLTHENVLPDYRDQTISGWGKILDGLAQNLA